MSRLDTAVQYLQGAFTALNQLDTDSALPEEHKPSALLLTVRPGHTPNSDFRIVGDPGLLVRVLLLGARDPSAQGFREALVDALPELLDLAY